MGVTDQIADMATLIRNASSSGKENVDVIMSTVNEKIIAILKKEKFIENYKPLGEDKKRLLRVYLKHKKGGTPCIIGIKRISKPGLRTYRKTGKIKPVLGGLGLAIISTSRGILTDAEARENNLGGEVLLEVW